MMGLDPRRTFETLLITPSNRPALRAIRRMLREGSTSPNVVLVRGPAGSGKTHLLHAIAHELANRSPRRLPRYFTGEQFWDAFVTHIRTGQLTRFRDDNTRFRSVLMLDGLEDLHDKEVAEEELHREIALLLANGGRAVMGVGPTDVRHLRRIERAMRPYGLGESVRWRAPAISTRLQALELHRRVRGVDVPRRVLVAVARRTRSIPEARAALDNALIRLRA
jgi:chromosomal replication initiator protein